MPVVFTYGKDLDAIGGGIKTETTSEKPNENGNNSDQEKQAE